MPAAVPHRLAVQLEEAAGAPERILASGRVGQDLPGLFALLALALLTTAWMAVDIAVRYGPLEISGVELSRLALVVVAVAWRHIYAPSGPLNQALRSLGLDSLARGWLGDPGAALPAVGVTLIAHCSAQYGQCV